MKKFSFLALCLLASAGLFAQTQVTADKTGVDLQAAIDAAKAGDTVYVQAGTFYGNFTMKDGVNVMPSSRHRPTMLLSLMHKLMAACSTNRQHSII